MVTFVSSVLDFRGLFLISMAMLMIRIVFTRSQSVWKELVTAAACAAGLLLVNGFFNYLGAMDLLPERAGFFVFYALLVAFAIIFGAFSLQVSKRQLSMTVLFQVGNMMLVFAMVNIVLASTVLTGIKADLALYFSTFAIVVLLALLYRMVTRPVTVRLSWWVWVLVDATQVLSAVLISIRDWRLEGVLYYTVLMAMDFAVYLFMIRMCNEMEEQLRTQEANQNLTFQVRQMDNDKAMLENVHKVRHELKNNYFYIETLIREEKYQAALQYMDEVIKPSFTKDEMVHTGNHLVDMILSQKVSEARQQSVPISVDVQLPAELGVNPEMLCSLLFNLLNNALEASAKVKEPQITFQMRQVRAYLEIQVSNRIEESVLKTNPQLSTSKKDRASHGIGMSMIREVVRHYHGDLQIEEKDGWFVVNVILAEE